MGTDSEKYIDSNGTLSALSLVFSCLKRHCLRTLPKLPVLLRDPYVLDEELDAHHGQCIDIVVQKSLVDSYNNDMKRVASQLRANATLQLTSTMDSMIISRLVLVVLALAGVSIPILCMVAIVTHIILMPLSIVVSIGYCVAIGSTLYVGHYIVFMAVQLLSPYSNILGFQLPYAPAHVVALFLIVDQLLCVCVFLRYGTSRLTDTSLKHYMFALINTKSYHVVLLACMCTHAQHVPLGWLVVDYALGISRWCAMRIAMYTGLHWSSVFYHVHRIGHLPRVYVGGGHKWHHTLLSTTAFDAHVYGSGLPEELASLVLELLCMYCLGIVPATFNGYTVAISWQNKLAHHPRPTTDPTLHADVNNHVGHHRFPTKNLGIFHIGLDLVFGTATLPPKGAEHHQYRDRTVKLITKQDDLIVRFEPIIRT